jgi:predicted HicB family RNase H-like nuclease
MKDVIREIVKAKLAPLKVKTSAYERQSYQGHHHYSIVCFDFTDDQVSGFKDWSAKKLPEILDELKAFGVEPVDFNLSQFAHLRQIPSLMSFRVEENAQVGF